MQELESRVSPSYPCTLYLNILALTHDGEEQTQGGPGV